MPQFAYSAINAQGNELSGEIHAADLSSARDVLLNGGLLAERIAEIKAGAGADKKKSGGAFQKKVQPKSLQVFSRQFATMIEAGLSVVTALVILEEQTDDQALGVVIADVREQVETGALLSEAMAFTRTSSAASTSRWSRPARLPACSTRSSTASRSRSRRSRRSSAG